MTEETQIQQTSRQNISFYTDLLKAINTTLVYNPIDIWEVELSGQPSRNDDDAIDIEAIDVSNKQLEEASK